MLVLLESRPGGLTAAEAATRLRRWGPNQIAIARDVPLWRLVLAQLRSAVAWLLLFAIVLSLAAAEGVDAVAISIVLLLNVAIGVSMEAGAHRALRALRDLETPRAIVARDGVVREIEARDLVPGDVVVLDEGRAVPADARVLEAVELRTAEAALTGESVPVAKVPHLAVPADTPLPDQRTMAFMGTTVVSGSGRAVVVATGARTELGRIGALVGRIRGTRTALERKLDALGGQLALAAGTLALVVVALGLARGAPVGELVRLGIALAVATVPEGLPVVATIALAVGVHRMARRRVLVRHLPSVEGLGSTTVVCSDKTGTLTTGAMTVTRLWLPGREIEVSGSGWEPRGAFTASGRRVDPDADPGVGALLRAAALASRASIEERNGLWHAVGDPTDAALIVAARKAGIERNLLLGEAPVAWEVPFSSDRMLSASAHRHRHGGRLYVKGSPRAVLAHCRSAHTERGAVALDPRLRQDVLDANESLSARGLRVLAIATGVAGVAREVPDDLTLDGLVAMTDPPAAGVASAIGALRTAGVRVVMVTGDQRRTAEAIARELGMSVAGDESVDARELAAMPDDVLAVRLSSVAVFSRVSPEDKLRIVEGFQRRGELVAVLGDGVNDAAALRRADIGVAMGRRGTAVAREAADIVLEDDRFASIVSALEEGRVIFDNLRKFIYYLVSCNLAEMLCLVVLPLVGLPVSFTPLQLLWLNLVTDTLPALALAAEPADPVVMRRPPRPPRRPILTGPLLLSASLHAVLLTLATVVAFAVTWHRDAAAAGTVAFLTLAGSQVLHLGNARSRADVMHVRRATANTWALLAVAACTLLLWLTVSVAPLARVLALRPIGPAAVLLVVGCSLFPAIIGQAWRARPRAT